MLIERIRLEGFAGLPEADLQLERLSRIGGSGLARTCLADALQLGFSVLDGGLLEALLLRWGCQDIKVDLEHGLPTGAGWQATPHLASLCALPKEGTLKVQLTLRLDPPLFGRIKAHATRDPRLVDAIAGGGLLDLAVGARLSPALDGLSLDLLHLMVGGERFSVSGPDRPDWLRPLLLAMGRRLQRGPAPEAWQQAAAQWDPTVQLALGRAIDALNRTPFRLGEMRLLPNGLARLKPDSLTPLRWLGPEAQSAAGLAAAVYLSRADLLVWEESMPSAWERWLAQQIGEEQAPPPDPNAPHAPVLLPLRVAPAQSAAPPRGPIHPLEQVILLGTTGDILLD